MRLLSQAAAHLAARAASALASSILFALIARRLTQDEAKTVFFLTFTVGFLAVFVRGFVMLRCDLRGGSRRSARLRQVIDATRQLLRLAPLLAIIAGGLLWLHPVPAALLLVALVLVLVAGLDADLVRAALGRPAVFSIAFTVGSVAGLLLMLTHPGAGIDLAVMALLCPWIPVAIVNLRVLVPLLWRHLGPRARTTHPLSTSWAGALASAAFDGVVLNAPFIAGVSLAPAAGFDLSVSMRLFSAAQPLFPLVMHWSNAGALARLATRGRGHEWHWYAALMLGSGLLASLAFVALYVPISGKPMTFQQYGLFALLLAAYCAYAAAVRYRAGQLSSQARWVALGALLALFVALGWIAWPWLRGSAAAVVAVQAGALATAAVVLAALAARTARR